MKFRDIGICLVGGTAVYVAMAACSSGGGGSGAISTKAFATGGGSPGTASAGGAPAASSGSGASGGAGTGPRLDSGIFDALTDPVATAFADPTDGSRLKATFLVGADGSKAYVAGVWFDSQRNEDCAFGTAGDGQNRCLPNGVSGEMFADSACTQPIIALPTGCATPTYAVVQASGTCAAVVAGNHIYNVGASTNPMALYVQNGASCFSAGTGQPGYDYYTIGAEVPATSFVAATPGHD